MTDEEIEKALASCGTVECNECPYKYQCIKVSKYALNYINRLKAKNKGLQDKNRRVLDWKRRQEKFNNEMIDRFDEELKKSKEQVRKNTAKEILDELKEACPQGYLGIGLWARQEYIKYGIEVDDEIRA